MKKFRVLMLILLFSFVTVNATVWYVHPDSTLNSIQAGIDLSSSSDTVLVAKGTYIENINFKGKAITVMSELGRDSTKIDGGSPSNPDTASVVTFVSSEDTNSVLDGFTITGGTGTSWTEGEYSGGGIYCYYASPKIINNIIYGNSPYTSGGGIECWGNSYPIISNNIIKENSTQFGGGIEITTSSRANITNNTISENTASSWGGGINCIDWSSPTIKSNTITDNTSPNGAGVFCCWSASPTIDSCVISNNTGGGVYCEGNATPLIKDNNIVNNQGYGVRNLDKNVTVNAENNWWGDETGPYNPSSNPDGWGDTVSSWVDFDPWLEEPLEGVGGVEEEEPDIEFLYISGCYPNPFIERTQIEYNIQIISNVNIAVYNVFGARVKSLLNERQNDGRHTITWNGRDEGGNKLPSGLYFLRLKAGVDAETRKLLLIR
jgi:parallel beta-helix repeat protein